MSNDDAVALAIFVGACVAIVVVAARFATRRVQHHVTQALKNPDMATNRQSYVYESVNFTAQVTGLMSIEATVRVYGSWVPPTTTHLRLVPPEGFGWPHYNVDMQEFNFNPSTKILTLSGFAEGDDDNVQSPSVSQSPSSSQSPSVSASPSMSFSGSGSDYDWTVWETTTVTGNPRFVQDEPEPDPALQPIRDPGEARRKIRILD